MRFLLLMFIFFYSGCETEKVYYESDDDRAFNSNGSIDSVSWNTAHQNLQLAFNRVVIDTGAYSQVNYTLLNSNPEINNAFFSYLSWLKQIPNIFSLIGPSQTVEARRFKRAFWINVYNACVLDIVRKNLDIIQAGKTINDIRSETTMGANTGVFDSAICEVAGSRLSLNEIETGLLRNARTRGLIKSIDSAALPPSLHADHDFSDSGTDKFDLKIHYGVNCASGSCPKLSAELFHSGNVDTLLKQLESDFWKSGAEATPPHRRQIRMQGSSVSVNPVFASWYKDDFEDLSGYIQSLLPSGDDISSKLSAGAVIVYTTSNGQVDYDWRSNITDLEGKQSFVYQENLP